MTKEDRERAFSDAAAHMALAISALSELLAGSAKDNGRDTILAHGITSAMKTQRGRIERRLKLGRHR